MKRDMDLVRELLRKIEEHPRAELTGRLQCEGRSEEEVNYHIVLAHDAGFIEAVNAFSTDGLDWIPQRLTWEGHEFLEAARDDALWQKAKDATRSKGGGLTLEVLKAVLVELSKRAAMRSILH
jgi:Hypothetical protein (DUF2513)